VANKKHLALLNQGVKMWNRWRNEHAEIEPDFSAADLSRAKLRQANLSTADFSGANLYKVSLISADLSGANLVGANLVGANLPLANLHRADLSRADLSRANLSAADLGDANLSYADLRGANFGRDADFGRANLVGANLVGANLSGATLEIKDLRETTLREANLSGHNLNNVDFSGMDLSGVNLNETSLIKTNFSHTNLSNCSIYGIAAWDIQLDEQTVQKNLTITPPSQPAITVDNLKIAQFIYLLLNNKEIRDVIDTITSKVVLLLGRFTPERKAVLDAIREELRKRNYSPIVFDFEKPVNRDITETVSTLAHMARFVIADITDAKSIPQELQTIVPNLPSVPIQPLILNSQHEYSMFEHFTRFSWVLPIYRYTDEVNLLQSLQEKVITPAEQKAKELAKR